MSTYKSFIREKKQTEISLNIINEMNKLSSNNNSKFVFMNGIFLAAGLNMSRVY